MGKAKELYQADNNFLAIGAAVFADAPAMGSQPLQFASDVTSRQSAVDCMVTNDSDKTGYVTFGKGAAVSGNKTGTAVRPGAQVILFKGDNDGIALYLPAAPTNGGGFHFQAGMGR